MGIFDVGLVTLEEMRLMRENIVQEREKKLAANLPTDEKYGKIDL